MPEVLDFYSNYYNIKWDISLRDARQLEIIVNYFDSWARNNWESIVEVYRRNGNISIFMTNPENPKYMDIMKDRYPDHSVPEIKKCIWDTVKVLYSALESSKPSNGELKIYFYDGILNYSTIRINNEKAIYSAYEQFRHGRIGNHAVLLDLEK
jgi:hypothetical protein